MANEITITGRLQMIKGDLRASMQGNDQKDMTGTHYVQRVDNIGVAEESVSKGDIATLGYCCFRNSGTVGTIRIGGVTGAYVITLDPGEYAPPIKWATNAIFAISSDAAGQLEMLLCEL